MDVETGDSFKKLQFLVSNPPFPPETFANLLLLYCKQGLYELAADILADNSHLTFSLLTPDLYELLDALIMTNTSPEEAFKKFHELSQNCLSSLKKQKLDKGQTESLNNLLIPAIMHQAAIYWEKGNYLAVEKILMQFSQFCSEHKTWKLNLAHTYFMSGSDFDKAAECYKPIIQEDMIRSIAMTKPIVAANLCVAYIINDQNEEAEDIMHALENAEKQILRENPEQKIYHSCIVNLVIGTLYCEKGNFEFGISRVCKSLEPFEQKLCPDTWFYAKRCLIALCENLSKHMLTIPDDSFEEIFLFLDQIDQHGRSISAQLDTGIDNDEEHIETKTTISSEARTLKCFFLKLYDYQ